jgi:hypothetical protein
MVGRKVCIGVEMAVGPGDPAGLNVVDGVLRHASVPVFCIGGYDATVASNNRFGASFSCFLGAGNGWPVFSSCLGAFLVHQRFALLSLPRLSDPPPRLSCRQRFAYRGINPTGGSISSENPPWGFLLFRAPPWGSQFQIRAFFSLTMWKSEESIALSAPLLS